RLERGEITTVRVTVPEGLNAREIGALLEARGLVDADRFHRRVMEGRDLVADLMPFTVPIPSLEGYLYPDTYQFPPSLGEEEIIRRMVARFLRQVYPLLQEYASRRDPEEGGLTPHEVITLASIVEKEAMVDRERPIIAGVFMNRL